MIYKIRLWLSTQLFRLGKSVHPDISRLRKEIEEQSMQISVPVIFANKDSE